MSTPETKEDYSSESEQSEQSESDSSTSSESGSDVEEVIVVKKPGKASELELARREAAKYKAKAAKYKAKSSVNVFLGDSSKRTAERQRALYDLS